MKDTSYATGVADSSDSVSALERGFRVLHCFGPGISVLSHLQIARATAMPKATVSRITQTLVKLGYLNAGHADGHFRLTAKTLELGHIYLSNVDVRAIAQPLMAQLADQTRATVNLVVRSGDHLVVVETCRSDAAVVAINSHIGFRFPILQTAIGRAYLSGLDACERASTVKALRHSVAAHEWKEIQVRVAKATDECAERGFCTLMGEWRQGVNSVAAPIHAGRDNQLYVINCAGPALHLEPYSLQTDVGPKLLQIVREIEKAVNVSWQKDAQ